VTPSLVRERPITVLDSYYSILVGSWTFLPSQPILDREIIDRGKSTDDLYESTGICFGAGRLSEIEISR